MTTPAASESSFKRIFRSCQYSSGLLFPDLCLPLQWDPGSLSFRWTNIQQSTNHVEYHRPVGCPGDRCSWTDPGADRRFD